MDHKERRHLDLAVGRSVNQEQPRQEMKKVSRSYSRLFRFSIITPG